ncbi:MAG: ribosome-binding factor A [Elusimicrobia bacterium RIFCSPLOWO2_02_FULL_39_32]|nr:MAG: ribosome-binding factor A [Elusimicrobia bacterium GWA2_38_7]OGR81394.1 MAG: ribosome-binding factor A [Elusimicrobia bacterium RIFCSPHIGHO2_02_FULL_39_36]OGR92039.1 MAG: ribosome-binding factor A [Elusimicrobia bacterium RIFCSPLOWO2_02_FULL_39_32]OGR98670.1 MAG: ribosome-binding factor A [Elusimicrobia bacterium RIFCSPLOWO2_12_FULL_39_28]
MQFKRSERVSELLRHEISLLIQEIKDSRLGFVTVTAVRLSDDLTDAKVFYSVFGSEEEKKISSEILDFSIPKMRKTLGRKLESLRKVPVISFVYDQTPEKAERVTAILTQLAKEKEEN